MTTVDITGDPFVHETAVEAPATGEDRYRHEVLDGDDLVALASYVWRQRALVKARTMTKRKIHNLRLAG